MGKREWLIITILTFITILAWVVFDLLHTRAEEKIPEQLQETIEPIDPSFDTGALQ